MLLSFELFVILTLCMIVISLTDNDTTHRNIPKSIHESYSKTAIALWILLSAVMITLYIYFN